MPILALGISYRGASVDLLERLAFPQEDLAKAYHHLMGTEPVRGAVILSTCNRVEIVADEEIAIGLVCTPAAVAQDVADRMVEAGIRSILNFAPAIVSVPAGVSLRKVDLSIELQILAFYEQRKAILSEVRGGKRPSSVPDAAETPLGLATTRG